MDDLPEEIQQALKNISTSGQNPGPIAANRATIDLYLTGILTKHLNALCSELKETRDQMSRSSAVASKQTEALVKTTKCYTVITGGLLLIAILSFILPLLISK
jgi:hypothetical protein